MAVPTDAQRANIYFFCGWPQRFVQSDSFPLESAINSIAQKEEQWALIVNPLTGDPPGLIAKLRQMHDVTIPGAFKRLKATQVGSIQLDAVRELRELRRQGRTLVGELCGCLGVIRENDVFSPGSGGRASTRFGSLTWNPSATNWIGK